MKTLILNLSEIEKLMKLKKLSILIFILVINFQSLFSQEKDRNLILLDSRPKITYEELSLLTDILASEINKIPNSIGYIVTYGDSDKIKNAFYKDAVIRNIKFRGYDKNKLRTLSAIDFENPRFEFWISKNGDSPIVSNENNPFILPKTNKPIKFVEDLIEIGEIDGKQVSFPAACDAGCIMLLDLPLLSDFLDANPQMTAYLIIHAKNLKRATQIKNILARESFEDAKIPSNRINFLFGGKNKINENQFSEVEVYLANDNSQLPNSSSIKYKPL